MIDLARLAVAAIAATLSSRWQSFCEYVWQSRMTGDGFRTPHFRAALILSLALAVTFSFGGCVSHTNDSYYSDQRINAGHAGGVLLSRGPFGDSFNLSAEFTLPDIRANRGWYTNWFILKEGAFLGGPFFQVGLMRDNEVHDPTLRPFIAGRNGSGPFYYRSFSPVATTPHRLTLIGKRRQLIFRVDGTTFVSVNRTVMFPPGSGSLYLEIGHELEKPGDVAQGTISNVRLSPSGESAYARPIEDLDCSYSHHGLKFARTGDTFQIHGEFDPSVGDAASGEFVNCFRWSILRLLH